MQTRFVYVVKRSREQATRATRLSHSAHVGQCFTRQMEVTVLVGGIDNTGPFDTSDRSRNGFIDGILHRPRKIDRTCGR
ncbi:MAG: hypothetical protein GF401_10650 [Chitinivibrionales bacterium]|nr:hypothetical protein [Chitinivibrionales bacterium]